MSWRSRTETRIPDRLDREGGAALGLIGQGCCALCPAIIIGRRNRYVCPSERSSGTWAPG